MDEEPHSGGGDDDDDLDNNISGQISSESANVYIAPNGMLWSKSPPVQNKMPAHNVVKFIPGPARGTNTYTHNDAWDLFISLSIVDEIVRCTNLEARRVCVSRTRTWHDVTRDEMFAFWGILLHTGADKGWDVPIRELFLGKFSKPLYRATMSVSQFDTLKRFIRFDDKRTREAWLQTDKLAAISYIRKIFIGQCRKEMIPKINVTLDEQLVPFRGCCEFVQYMPNNPAKCGMKIFWMCEAETGYTIDGTVYTGR